MEQLLNTEIYAGNTVGDYLSLEFLASLAGSVLAAIVLLVIGMTLAGWRGGSRA
jgi:small conductance mechanosensitive channel